jgi:hypothetical protein
VRLSHGQSIRVVSNKVSSSACRVKACLFVSRLGFEATGQLPMGSLINRGISAANELPRIELSQAVEVRTDWMDLSEFA